MPNQNKQKPKAATSESRRPETKTIKTSEKPLKVAEGEGFEPPVGFILRLISSQVP